MKEMTDRQKSMEKYGVYFSKNATTSEIVAKCEQQIDKYIKWQKNLEELKTEKEKEVESLNEKTRAIAEGLNSLSEEERILFLKNYKPSATIPKKQN